jgi:hypothetical protein
MEPNNAAVAEDTLKICCGETPKGLCSIITA